MKPMVEGEVVPLPNGFRNHIAGQRRYQVMLFGDRNKKKTSGESSPGVGCSSVTGFLNAGTLLRVRALSNG